MRATEGSMITLIIIQHFKKNGNNRKLADPRMIIKILTREVDLDLLRLDQ